MTFDQWLEQSRERFHQFQFDDEEQMLAAWNAGRAQVANFCANCETTELHNAELEAAIAAYAAQQVGDIEQRRELRAQLQHITALTERNHGKTQKAFAAWGEQVAGLNRIIDRITGERDAAQADAAALRQLLRSLEWDAPMGNCPDCGGRGPDSGHFTWCRLAPMLATPNPGAPLLAELATARTEFATLHAAVQQVIFTLNSRDEDAAALERALTALEQVADLNKESD